MKRSQDTYDYIVASLQDAVLTGTQWPEVERRIGEVTRTSGSAISLTEGRTPAEATVFSAQFSARGQCRKDLVRWYMEDYWAEDERVTRIARLKYGRIAASADLYTDAEKKTSPAYNEALVKFMAQSGINLRLAAPDGSYVLWLIGDSTERGGWSSGQIRLIHALKPHVRQFTIMHHALAEAEVTGTATSALLSITRLGVIHLDRDGRIVTANDRASEILRQGGGLLERDGFLRIRRSDENAELSRLLARALPSVGPRGLSAGSMRVGRSSSPAQRLALHISPVNGEYPHFQPRRIGAVVLIADPASSTNIDPTVVAAALGLSPTESRLAVALAAGRTLKDIAEATGRSRETVRWQLKEIFRKQGVSRQVDLVRRVLSLESFPTD